MTLLPRSRPVKAKGPRVRSGLAMDDATTNEQPVVGFVERLACLFMDKPLQSEAVPMIDDGRGQMQREIALVWYSRASGPDHNRSQKQSE